MQGGNQWLYQVHSKTPADLLCAENNRAMFTVKRDVWLFPCKYSKTTCSAGLSVVLLTCTNVMAFLNWKNNITVYLATG